MTFIRNRVYSVAQKQCLVGVCILASLINNGCVGPKVNFSPFKNSMAPQMHRQNLPATEVPEAQKQLEKKTEESVEDPFGEPKIELPNYQRFDNNGHPVIESSAPLSDFNTVPKQNVSTTRTNVLYTYNNIVPEPPIVVDSSAPSADIPCVDDIFPPPSAVVRENVFKNACTTVPGIAAEAVVKPVHQTREIPVRRCPECGRIY